MAPTPKVPTVQIRDVANPRYKNKALPPVPHIAHPSRYPYLPQTKTKLQECAIIHTYRLPLQIVGCEIENFSKVFGTQSSPIQRKKTAQNIVRHQVKAGVMSILGRRFSFIPFRQAAG